jgi:hypothetical protein
MMAGDVLELRVHGVSNTPPGDLLGPAPAAHAGSPSEPALRRVAGDEITGFYRAQAGAGEPGEPLVEAYSWGQLTSGERGVRTKKDIQRALWTLLLPFALANLALHARTNIPAPGEPSRRSRVGAWLTGYLVRLFCLSLTVTVVVAATGVGVDLVAWQCVDAACLDQIPGSWRFLAEGFWSGAGRAFVIGLAAPLVLLSLIGLAAWRSYHYEAELPEESYEVEGVEGVGGAEEAEHTATAPGNPLQDRSYWRGEIQVRGLFAIHLATGLVVAAAIPFAVLVHLEPPQGGQLWLAWLTAALLLATVVLAIVGLGHPSITNRGRILGRPFGKYPLGSGLAGLAAVVLYLLWSGSDRLAGHRPPPGCTLPPAAWRDQSRCYEDWSLPFYDEAFTWFGVGQLLVLALLAVTGLPRHLRRRPGPDRLAGAAWFGMGPAVFAGFGWTLGMAYASGILYWATNRLNLGATPTGRSIITLAAPLLWTGVAVVVLLLAVLVIGLVVLVRWQWLRRGGLQQIQQDPHFVRDGVKTSAHAQRRARTVASWYGFHRVVERDGLRAAGWIALVAAILAAGGLGLSIADMFVGGEGVRPSDSPANLWEHVLKGSADLGSWLAGLVPAAVAVVALLTYRLPTFRRGIGVVWDIAAFWPRSAHPLAPPSYAETAVPQLQTRVAQLLDLPAGSANRAAGVIFSGHSQGALICLATILQLRPAARRRIWLVTHGCQLNRLYGRVFPAYTGPEQLARVSRWLRQEASEPRWTSFWRETDPLGYQVRAGNDEIALREVLLTDPASLRPTGGEVLAPPIRNHSDYPYDARYQDECRRIHGVLAGND